MKKMKNAGISALVGALLTTSLVLGIHYSFEAEAAKTCSYARCHVYTGDCLPGNKISARPRCTYTACINELGCGDPITE
jgi:hypothetical protein